MSKTHGLVELYPNGCVLLRNPDGSEALRLSVDGDVEPAEGSERRACYDAVTGSEPVHSNALAHAIGAWLLAVIRDAAQNVIAETSGKQPPTQPVPVITDPDEADRMYGKNSGIGDVMRRAVEQARSSRQIEVVSAPHRDEPPESERVGALPLEVDDSSHPDDGVPLDAGPLHLPELAPLPVAICDRCKEDRPCACEAYEAGFPDVTAQDWGKKPPTRTP